MSLIAPPVTADPFFRGTTYEECVEWLDSIYGDVEFNDKQGLMIAQYNAIMAARELPRPYPEFVAGSTARVHLRDAREYAFDVMHGFIYNIKTKQILQESKSHQVPIGGKPVCVYSEGLRACVPLPDYPGVSSDHINQDHTDHRFCNLRWGSPALQTINQTKPTSHKGPSIQVLEDGIWVTYDTRKVFAKKLGLEYTASMIVMMSLAINEGTKFKGYLVRNGIPHDIGELKDIPASVIGVTGFKASEFGGYIHKPNGGYFQGCLNKRTGSYSIGINGSKYQVHVLTTYAFWGPKPSKDAQSNHKKGIWNGPADAKDLEWCSPSANIQHAYDTGLNPGARAVVATLKGTPQEFHSIAAAVRLFKDKGVNLSKGGIVNACNGKRKTHGKMTWKYADGGGSRKRKFIDDDE